MSTITSQPRPNEMYNVVPTNENVNPENNDTSQEDEENPDKKQKRTDDGTEDIETVIETCCCPDPCWLFECSNSCFESIASCIQTCCEDSSNDNIIDTGNTGSDNCDVDCVDCFCTGSND